MIFLMFYLTVAFVLGFLDKGSIFNWDWIQWIVVLLWPLPFLALIIFCFIAMLFISIACGLLAIGIMIALIMLILKGNGKK